MKNNLIAIFTLLFLLSSYALAQNNTPCPVHKPGVKEQKQFDYMLNQRLQLTNEQKEYIKQNRSKHVKEMQKTISEMENLRKKINDVYLLGIPKFQADIRTAPYKAELAILKQNAQKQKEENRKNFENILTKEQKAEFEKMKKEHQKQRPPLHSSEKNN